MTEFNSINLKRPSLKGFAALKRCAYELTGAQCYLNNEMYLEETSTGKITLNLISNFWFLKNEVQKLIKSGYVCKYSLCNGLGEQLPYIYNRLIF